VHQLHINNWALDITKDYTYTVVHGVLGDLASLFFENLMHLGCDEVTMNAGAHTLTSSTGSTPATSPLGRLRVLCQEGAVYGRTWVRRSLVGRRFGTFRYFTRQRTIIQQWLPKQRLAATQRDIERYRLIGATPPTGTSTIWVSRGDDVRLGTLHWAPARNCALILGGEGCSGARRSTPPTASRLFGRVLPPIAERLLVTLYGDRVRLEQDPCPHVRLPVLLNEREFRRLPWTTQRPAKRPRPWFVLRQ